MMEGDEGKRLWGKGYGDGDDRDCGERAAGRKMKGSDCGEKDSGREMTGKDCGERD